MELKVFLKNILKFWQVLTVLAVLGGTAGFVFSFFQVEQYKTAVSIYFAPVNSENQLEQSANEFTDTILGILLSSDFDNLEKVKVRKIAPQLIQFQISALTKDETVQVAQDLPKNLDSKLTEILGAGKTTLKSISPKVEITSTTNPTFLNILVGAAVGFVLGLALVSSIIYFRA